MTFVLCSRTHPAVIEPIRAGEAAGKYALAFLAPEAADFYNRANEPEIAEYFLVCHGRRFDALATDGPAFAKAAGYAAILGDAEQTVEIPGRVFVRELEPAYPSASSRACAASSVCIASAGAHLAASA